MNTIFTTPIQSLSDAEGFLFELDQLGLALHLEDSPDTVIDSRTGKPLFTPEEAQLMAERVKEVFEHMEDPIQYLLDLSAPADDDERSYGPKDHQ